MRNAPADFRMASLFGGSVDQALNSNLAQFTGEHLKPGSRFKVKVQISTMDRQTERVSGGDMYIYNKERTWKHFMPSTDPNYAPLHQQVATLGVGGLKGYFQAIVGKAGDVRIDSDQILPPQNW